MRLTVCVDALQPHLSGIGRYTWELCKGLTERADIDPLYFYRNRYLVDEPASLLSESECRPTGTRQLRWLQRWQARRALRSTLVHAPNYFLPADAGHGVITVHDLSVLRFPETHPIDRVKTFEKEFQSSLGRAAHVITDSETIRRELIETFAVPAIGITAVPLGVERRFRPMHSDEIGPILNRFGLTSQGYGLSVAAFEPRKRLSELIAAWRELPKLLRDRCPLILAGTPGWRNEALREAIARGEAEGWLKHLGFVEDSLLPFLYAGARVFVYPSTYEGFGLPPIEAMASGAPVIVSGQSCLREICGDGAFYVDPSDLVAFTSAIEMNLEDEQRRLALVRRAVDRAALYTWDRCVGDTVAVYRKIAN